MGGIITAKKDKITKSNAFMSFLSFEDLTGGLEVIVFPKVLQEAGPLVAEDAVVTLRARVSIKEEEDAKLVAIGFSPLENNKGGKTLTVTVNDPLALDRLHPVVMAHRGGDRLELLVGGKRVEARPCCYVQISPALIGEVEQIMGEGSTMVV